MRLQNVRLKSVGCFGLQKKMHFIDAIFASILFQEKLSISLFASAGSSNTLMGSVDISLAEVLMFPQNKIQLTTKVMSISDECDHTEQYCGCNVTMTKPRHLGNLTLWFRLTCELDVLKSLYNEYEQWRPQTDNPDKKVTPNTVSNLKSAEPQQSAEHTNLEMTPASNRDTSCDQPKDEHNLVAITIQCLKLNTNFELPTNTTEHIHIECNFLGSRRLKTHPQLLSTNQLTFNFTHKYSHSERNVQRLTSAINDSEHSIKFVLVKAKAMQNATKSVSETNANVTSDDESKLESLEIGFGLLHLGKFVREWNGGVDSATHTIAIPILSKKPPYQNIGNLDILIDDIEALKTLQQ